MAIAAAPALNHYNKTRVLSDLWSHVADTWKSLLATLTGKSSIPEWVQRSIWHAARLPWRIAEWGRDIVNAILPWKWSDFAWNFIGRRSHEALERGYMWWAPRISGMIKSIWDACSSLWHGRYRDMVNNIGEFTWHSPIGMVRDLLIDPIRWGKHADYSNKGRTMWKIRWTWQIAPQPRAAQPGPPQPNNP